MLYGSKMWPPNPKARGKKLSKSEDVFVLLRDDKIKNVDIWRRTGSTCSITAKEKLGKPRLSWEKYIYHTMKDRGLKEEDWFERELKRPKTEKNKKKTNIIIFVKK